MEKPDAGIECKCRSSFPSVGMYLCLQWRHFAEARF